VKPSKELVVGIDVGGFRKGYHAVALSNGAFAKRRADKDPKKIVKWCLEMNNGVLDLENFSSPPASGAGGERNLNQWFDRILNEFY
jgi:hypothetical protein